MSAYIITKVLNNNVVYARSFTGEDVIVTGYGIGFRHHAAEVLGEDEIASVYAEKNEGFSERFIELAQEIPYEYVRSGERVVELASRMLSRVFSPNLVISLSDHIAFAIEHGGLAGSGGLLLSDEIAGFYPEEMAVGIRALDIIEEESGVHLDTREASAIAFHLISNSRRGTDMDGAMQVMEGIGKMLSIIEKDLDVALERGSLAYQRIVTHLKFLMLRIIEKRELDEPESLVLNTELATDRAIAHTTDGISRYLREAYGHPLSESERFYLQLHLAVVFAYRGRQRP